MIISHQVLRKKIGQFSNWEDLERKAHQYVRRRTTVQNFLSFHSLFWSFSLQIPSESQTKKSNVVCKNTSNILRIYKAMGASIRIKQSK